MKLTRKATIRFRWQYDTNVINQTKRIWLKNDKVLTKVDSHGMDKLIEKKISTGL
jgi:hypothetical protein